MSMYRSYDDETRRGGGLLTFLTVLIGLMTVLVFALYVFIFFNPYHPINPFPPYATMLTPAPTGDEPVGLVVPPTFTPPPTFPPTWTPSVTPLPTQTGTPRPTGTARPPTKTPTARVLPMQFVTREAPKAVQQLLYGAGANSWWTGVAGEVSDENGEAVTDVVIRIWDDKGHAWETSPGGAADYARVYGTSFGGGGSYAWWEQHLDGSCAQSFTIYVQVKKDGKVVSDPVTTQTSGTCAQNLVLVHFKKRF
jgi:hypothetical protein